MTQGIDVRSLKRVAKAIANKRTTSKPRESIVDVVAPARSVAMELVGGRGHYDRVIAAIREAHTSIWIATANVKEDRKSVV